MTRVSNENPRIIVGVGYLGRVVARLWRSKGHRVLGTTRKTERFAELEALGVEPILWDVADPGDHSLPDAETLLYCVGFDRSVGKTIQEIYVDGLRNTLSRVGQIERLIYISSTGVYGDANGAWIDESWPADPIDDSGRACLEAESVARHWSSETRTPLVILRLAGIYGPKRLIGAASLRAGTPLDGDPEQFLNLIHVEDAANVVEAARTRGRESDVYLVSDGNPVARGEFYQYLCKQIGAPEPNFSASVVGMKSRRGRGNRRIRNRKMLEELRPILQYSDYRLGLAQSCSDK